MPRNYSDILKTDRKALLTLCLILLFGQLSAQSVIEWKADTTRMRIGEQVKLSVHIQTDEGTQVEFPRISSAGDSLEVVNMSDIDTTIKKGKASYKVDYYLTSFDKGKFLVPSIPVRVGSDTLSTDPFAIEVMTVPVDTLKQARFGIKDIRPEPYTVSEVISKYYWILIVLAVLALIIWELNRRRKARLAAQIPPEMLLSPYERAKFRLGKLDSSHYAEKGLIKEYYVEMTDVLRLFLEEQYDVSALESTSTEILRDTRKLKLPKEVYSKLKELLLDSDLVKFAKMYPLESDNIRYRGYTEQIIDALKPVENPQNTKEDAKL